VCHECPRKSELLQVAESVLYSQAASFEAYCNGSGTASAIDKLMAIVNNPAVAVQLGLQAQISTVGCWDV
jgi:hypothetical protein